jgi:hypothetical protein
MLIALKRIGGYDDDDLERKAEVPPNGAALVIMKLIHTIFMIEVCFEWYEYLWFFFMVNDDG